MKSCQSPELPGVCLHGESGFGQGEKQRGKGKVTDENTKW